jgi:predicted nucleic acid-binding protein
MSKTVVVDANIVLKWVLNEDDSSNAIALLAEWKRERAIVLAPSLLIYEASNILYRETRAKKISNDTAQSGINMILRTIVLVSPNEPTLYWRAMAFSERFGLPAAYDTQYLSLAEREECELWTADTKMRRAVQNEFEWVKILGDYHPAPSENA